MLAPTHEFLTLVETAGFSPPPVLLIRETDNKVDKLQGCLRYK